MPALKLLPLVALVCLLLPAAPASAQATTPVKRVLYNDGPTNRYLMNGPWLFRLDRGNRGLSEGFHKQTGAGGWSRTTVPNAWNAGDESVESMRGTVGWYRKD